MKRKKILCTTLLFIGVLCIGIFIHFEDSIIKREYSEYRQDVVKKSSLIPTHLPFNQQHKLPKPVIILTYMRSGSSFVGQILHNSPDVFYFFEPLITIQHVCEKDGIFRYFYKQPHKYTNFLDIAFETVSGLSTCNFFEVPKQFWDVRRFFYLSENTKQYLSCIKSNISKENSVKPSAIECIKSLKEKCQQSPFVAMKTIRMPMSVLKPLLHRIPDLKVIHLMRDPRATVKSRLRYNVKIHIYLQRHATEFCDSVYKDVLQAEEFDKIYPDRIIRIFYEDLVKHPFMVSKALYKFIGLKFTTHVENKIRNMTSSGINKGCKMICTSRGNSTKYADSWRNSMNWRIVKEIDNSCKKLYYKLGYNPIESELQLRNFSYNLRQNLPGSSRKVFEFA